MTLAVGDRLGNFEVLGLLGEGGMGVVYHARDLRLDRTVALKVLAKSIEDDPAHIARFRQEADVLAALDHPNVGALYDLLELDGQNVLVLQYVEGETLAQHLDRGALQIDEALDIFVQVARALEAAHDKGIVHRDLKPANIKIGAEKTVRVLDFGMASSPTSRLGAAPPPPAETSEGPQAEDTSQAYLGTPSYMSPEQVKAQAIDQRTDIWSFGCCLFQGLAGALPFQAESLPLLMAAIVQREPQWHLLPPDTDPEILALLRRCLYKDPKNRLSNARCVALALEDVSEKREEEARQFQEGGDAWQPAVDATIPDRGHWVLRERRSQGGFGDVWMAEHAKTSEKRIFKFCNHPDRVRALKREGVLFRLMRKTLGHRRDIAQILDWQLEEPPFYLELEYTEAGDITQWAEKQGGLDSIPLATRIDIARQAAEALAAAHSAGVLHKDIKPANILLREDKARDAVQVCLTDFGIGLLTDRGALEEHGITATGYTEAFGESNDSSGGSGTRMYMAPEVVECKPASTLSDVYSMGVVLYQLVVGDFSRSLAQGWEGGLEDELLREDILACVSGNPEERFPSARALAKNLSNLEVRRQEREAAARNREALEQAQALVARARRRRKLFLLAFACGVVVILFTILIATREAHLRGTAEEARQEAEQHAQLAERQRERAEQEHDLAEANFRLARAAVDEAFGNVGLNVLLTTPEMQPLRRELLTSMLRYYQDFADTRQDDLGVRIDLAYTQFSVALILFDLGEAGWVEAIDAGLDMLDTLIEEDVPESLLKQKVSAIYRHETYFSNQGNATAISQPLGVARILTRSKTILGELIRRYPNVLPFKSDLATLHHANAEFRNALFGPEASIANFTAALTLWEELIATAPGHAAYHAGYAAATLSLALRYRDLGRSNEMLTALEAASSAIWRTVELRPGVPRYQEMSGNFTAEYAHMLSRMGRFDEALAQYDLAAGALRSLFEDYPGIDKYREDYVVQLRCLGGIHLQLGHFERSIENYDMAVSTSTNPARELKIIVAAIVEYEDLSPEGKKIAQTYTQQLTDLESSDP